MIAIAWMLLGPIINGIVIGTITTSLTTIKLQTDPTLYGSTVSALYLQQLAVLWSNGLLTIFVAQEVS